jgi:hypothetical protein
LDKRTLSGGAVRSGTEIRLFGEWSAPASISVKPHGWKHPVGWTEFTLDKPGCFSLTVQEMIPDNRFVP